MAAYAAFKHIELYNVGKTKKRVLRPPGGGSSDIFGTDFSQTPRNNKNHMHSQIFSSGKNSAVKNNEDQPRRAQRSNDSYLHLFGEPNRPNTSAKNHMKSSIQFGQSDEAAQLLANGNGHHHFSEKNSSVSSTSSSISSSTENLKVNGAYKTEIDKACPQSDPTPDTGSVQTEVLDNDLPCDDKSLSPSEQLKDSNKHDVGSRDFASNTRTDSGCNPENPPSLSKMPPNREKKEPIPPACTEILTSNTIRNPITGLGLGGDGVGGLKPKKPKSRRDGNPVTGEGYKPGNDLNPSIPHLNGTNKIINKNRIPPGGFSSGLW